VKLTQRLLLGALLLIGVLTITVLAVVDGRLRAGLLAEARRELEREAWVVAALWTPETDTYAVARAAGRALEHRVTLLLPNGHPLGDSELSMEQMRASGDLRELPEVAVALRDSIGWHLTESATGRELRVAVLAPQGIVRIAYDLEHLNQVFAATRRDLLAAGLVALLVAATLAWYFARAVTRPVIELRDVARALAAGDLTRRPALAAPAEVGDLASAVHRLAEQLAGRMEALRSEEALLVALIEALNEGVVAVDRRPQVVRINATGRRLLNVRSETPLPIEHLPRERALRAALAAALRGEATDAAEAVIGGRTLVLAARPLPEGGAVLALYDLTQIRKLEAVRRDFVANVSHELRTPLTVVGGFAETLADDDLPPPQRRQFAETIRQNAHRMQRIVDDLLDLSRIESGGWVPKPEPLAVRAIANEVLTACTTAAGAKGVTLEVDLDPAAPTVFADPTALRQVLGNLVDNAVRHTSDGSVRVFSRAMRDGGTEVGVTDTGSGIAPEHRPRIFERVDRADPARSREAGGTGLGLAIVRHLVEAHGGRVSAASTVGQGTTIAASFPPASAAAAARGPHGARAAIATRM
jgi:two-component system phosphate regulon sensor histidine kinase PhoR